MLNDFLSLFYPRLCLACGHALQPTREMICVQCDFKMPKTNFHENADNPITQKFWGRVDVQFAASMFLFRKGNPVQHLIHQLKYRSHPEVGVELGKKYGKTLAESLFFSDVDLIVPVPLHPNKLRKRGYNQSAMFADGLAEGMQRKNDNDFLTRYTASESQTHKTRMERMNVIEGMFDLEDVQTAEGKHILLVDDVLTTGATLEGCATQLLQIPNVRVSIATIAIAGH